MYMYTCKGLKTDVDVFSFEIETLESKYDNRKYGNGRTSVVVIISIASVIIASINVIIITDIIVVVSSSSSSVACKISGARIAPVDRTIGKSQHDHVPIKHIALASTEFTAFRIAQLQEQIQNNRVCMRETKSKHSCTLIIQVSIPRHYLASPV